MLEKKSSSVTSTSSESDVLLQIAPQLNHHLHNHGLQELPEDGELDIAKLNLPPGGGGSGSDVDEDEKQVNHKYHPKQSHTHRKTKAGSCSFHSSDEIIDEEDLLMAISDTDHNDIPIIPGMIFDSVTEKNGSDPDFDSAFEDSLYSGSSDDKNKKLDKGGSMKNKSRRKSTTNQGGLVLDSESETGSKSQKQPQQTNQSSPTSPGKYEEIDNHDHKGYHPEFRDEGENPPESRGHEYIDFRDELQESFGPEPELTLFDMEVSPRNHSRNEIMPALQETNLLPNFHTYDKNLIEETACRHQGSYTRRVHYDDPEEIDGGMPRRGRGRRNYSDDEASDPDNERETIIQETTEFDTILLPPPLDMEVQLSPLASPQDRLEPNPETLQNNTETQLCRESNEFKPSSDLISPVGIHAKNQDEAIPTLQVDFNTPSSPLENVPLTPDQNKDLTSLPLNINPSPDPSPEQDYDVVYVVPDGGWGWMVLFGSILVNILIPGTVKSFGILFVEFLEVFKATPTAAAWIPALSYFLYSSTGPFAGALATKYSHRSVTIVGGLLASVGLMLSYFATSISYLYVSYGIIGGLGAGLAYPVGVFMVGQYFEKRRGLANGLCTSGSALGSVLIPPLLRVLLSEYGYRGAILIMGAILLNVCIGAMFYEPVSKHMKRVLVPRDKSVVIKSPEKEEIDRLGLEEAHTQCPALQPSFPQRQVTNPIPSKTVQAPIREIAASMPIAIPMPQLMRITDFRDVGISRRGSNSGRKATFQIGHEDDSWSYQSNEIASPLAARLVKEADPNSSGTVSSPNRWSFYNPTGGIRIRGHLPGITRDPSNPELETLIHSNSSGALTNTNVALNPTGVPSTSLSLSVVGTSRGQSRLNLTAIPEDDDNDTNSEGQSQTVDWTYYSALPPSKQRLLRLSVGGTQSPVGSAIVNTHSAHPSSGALVNQSHGLPRTLSVASNVSTSSFHYMSTIHHGSLLTAMQFDKHIPEFASTLTLKSVRYSCCPRLSTVQGFLRKLTCGLWPSKSNSEQERDEHDCRTEIMTNFHPETGAQLKTKSSKTEKLKKFIDFSLLKDGMYLIMLMSNSTTAVGYTNFIVLLPSYALAMGFDMSQAATLLSIVAALDFVGRIGGAALSDLQFISRRWYYIVGLFFSGVALSLLPFARTYSSLATMCACFGLASGTYIGVTAVILADQLGAEKLGSSYGISLFLNGLLQLIGPPICGALYQSTGKLEPIFTGLGITLIIGALMWIFAPFIERRRRKKEEKLAFLRMCPTIGEGESKSSTQIVQNANVPMNRSETSLV